MAAQGWWVAVRGVAIMGGRVGSLVAHMSLMGYRTMWEASEVQGLDRRAGTDNRIDSDQVHCARWQQSSRLRAVTVTAELSAVSNPADTRLRPHDTRQNRRAPVASRKNEVARSNIANIGPPRPPLRTHADKQRAVQAALVDPGGAAKSDSAIAKHVGVDTQTVANWCEQLELTSEIRKSVAPQGRTANGSLGKERRRRKVEGAGPVSGPGPRTCAGRCQ